MGNCLLHYSNSKNHALTALSDQNSKNKKKRCLVKGCQ